MTTAGLMSSAEREKMKTLHGSWRTPIPIVFVDDNEASSASGEKCYKGEERDEIRMTVVKKEVKVGDTTKVKRVLTLHYYERDADGDVDLTKKTFTMTGRANIAYDRIKFDNGACWVREHVAKANMQKKPTIQKEAQHWAAPPPDFEAAELRPKKLLQKNALHSAPSPEWNQKVAEIGEIMVKQLEAAHRKHLMAEACHGAPPPMDSDTEAAPLPDKVFAADSSHEMFCCGSMCGGKPQVMEDQDQAEPLNQPEAPPPDSAETKELADGFFDSVQLDDVIDRINDCVGVWGISESKEREYIKPPVVAMNKMIKAAMNAFMDNPLVDLIQKMMDEAMDLEAKAIAFGMYLNEHFIQPLCEHLMTLLGESFNAFSWIKHQVMKVMNMMSQMVTDEVMTRTVTALNDSDLVD